MASEDGHDESGADGLQNHEESDTDELHDHEEPPQDESLGNVDTVPAEDDEHPSTPEDDTVVTGAGSPWFFLLGFIVFFGGIVLYGFDLIFGNDILRGILVNAAGAVLLLAWAAHDTFHDPNSEVASVKGAAGTVLMLYGLYLLLAGGVIVTTGLFFHERVLIGFWYLGLSVASVVLGFLIFPRGALQDEE